LKNKLNKLVEKANFLWENEKMAEFYKASIQLTMVNLTQGFRFAKLI